MKSYRDLSASVYVGKGEFLLNEGEWDEATIELKAAVKLDELQQNGKERRRVIFLTAVLCEGLQRKASAQAKYEEVEASQHWMSGELDEIEAACRKALTRHCATPASHIVLGAVLRQREDWVGARREYVEGLRLGRADERWTGFASAHLKALDREEELDMVCTAPPHTPRDAKVSGTLYLSLALLGDELNQAALIREVVKHLSLWIQDASVVSVHEGFFAAEEKTVEIEATLSASILSLDVLQSKVNRMIGQQIRPKSFVSAKREREAATLLDDIVTACTPRAFRPTSESEREEGSEQQEGMRVAACLRLSFEPEGWVERLLPRSLAPRPEQAPGMGGGQQATTTLLPAWEDQANSRLHFGLTGWSQCREFAIKLGLQIKPRWETGSRCNYDTSHWDDAFWLANDAAGQVLLTEGAARVEIRWDCVTKVVYDSVANIQLCCIDNYDVAEEICSSLGANSNEYLPGHWTTRDIHGIYEGSLVYWSWRERTITVTTQGPRGLDLLLGESTSSEECERREVDRASQLEENRGLTMQDLLLLRLGCPIVLPGPRKAVADLIFDAYDTDFSGSLGQG